jgi:hypothetical protein
MWTAAETPGQVDLSIFAQYGVLGIFAALLVWFARGAYQRERERADRIEEENRRLNAIIQDRVIPALTSATRAAEESGSLLSAIQREREQNRLLDLRIRAARDDARDTDRPRRHDTDGD